MAWCDVVEPRTLRECRIALGQSQAAFAKPFVGTRRVYWGPLESPGIDRVVEK